MIISIDAEKAFDKIQHPFMIKTLHKIGIEGKCLNIIKAIYDKPSVNIILNGKKTKYLPSKIKNKEKLSTIATVIQYNIGGPSECNQPEKDIKGIQIGNKEVRLFADDMILSIEHPKDSTRTLLETINKYSKVSGYKINVQKSIAVLCSNNEVSVK